MVHVVVIAAAFTHGSAKDIFRGTKTKSYLGQRRAWSPHIATKQLQMVLQVG
jgi:hypothetical protein